MTEEVLGVDLVKSQLAVAAGATLASLGLTQSAVPAPRGYAMQLRINMEVMDEKGMTKPTGGTLAVFDPPSGPGVRVDTFGYSGYKTSAAFDSLLAKVIVHSPAASWPDVVQKAARALREFRIAGVATNIPFIQAVLAHPDFIANRITTDFIDTHVAALVGATRKPRDRCFCGRCGAPDEAVASPQAGAPGPVGSVPVQAPLQGTVVVIEVAEGDMVLPGASKITHHRVDEDGTPRDGPARRQGHESHSLSGVTLMHGEPIMFLEPAEVDGDEAEEEAVIDLDHIRPDLAEVIAPCHYAR